MQECVENGFQARAVHFTAFVKFLNLTTFIPRKERAEIQGSTDSR